MSFGWSYPSQCGPLPTPLPTRNLKFGKCNNFLLVDVLLNTISILQYLKPKNICYGLLAEKMNTYSWLEEGIFYRNFRLFKDKYR